MLVVPIQRVLTIGVETLDTRVLPGGNVALVPSRGSSLPLPRLRGRVLTHQRRRAVIVLAHLLLIALSCPSCTAFSALVARLFTTNAVRSLSGLSSLSSFGVRLGRLEANFVPLQGSMFNGHDQQLYQKMTHDEMQNSIFRIASIFCSTEGALRVEGVGGIPYPL